MTIGDRLKQYAQIRCGSVRKLAEEIGWTADNLGKYTAGRNEPGAKLLRQLIEHGCSATWLLSGKGSMLVKDLEIDDMSGEDRALVVVLKSVGITEARTLEALIAGLYAILSAHESLKSHLGNRFPEPAERKTKKSVR